MMILNYLFYRFSQLKIYRPTYWARIFIPVLVAGAFLPTGLTLSRYFLGCYNQTDNDGDIKIGISVIVILLMTLSNFYYSPQKTKKLAIKYSGESKVWGNIKLFLICIVLLAIFFFGSVLVRAIVKIPAC
jgi:hypothetical protein